MPKEQPEANAVPIPGQERGFGLDQEFEAATIEGRDRFRLGDPTITLEELRQEVADEARKDKGA